MQQLQLLASQQESAVIKLQSAWRVRAACKHWQLCTLHRKTLLCKMVHCTGFSS
jgi:hypothetical protein